MNFASGPLLAASSLALVISLAGCTNSETPGSAAPGSPGSSGSSGKTETGLGAGGNAAAQAVQVDEAVAELVPQVIKDRGVLRLVTDPTYAPMDFTNDEGDIIGLDPDLALAVANKMGVDMEIAKGDFNGILAGLSAGRYDASWAAFSVTAERQQEVDMVSYIDSATSVMVQRDNPQGIEEVLDLCGQTVAAQTGTTQALTVIPDMQAECEAAGEDPIKELILPQQDVVNQAVATGRATAMAADNALVAYFAQVQPEIFSPVDAIQLQPAPVGVAITKEDPQLAAAFEAALQSLQEDGTYETILEAWNLSAAAIEDPSVNPA